MSILQENLNYSPALNFVCQILPQFQSYRCLLTRGIKKIIFFFFLFFLFVNDAVFVCVWGVWVCVCVCVTGANACLDPRGVSEGGVPPQKLEAFVFLKLVSCNLVNTFWRKLKQAMSKKKKVVWILLTQILAFWEKFWLKISPNPPTPSNHNKISHFLNDK